MADPWRHLKYLPWIPLAQVATLITLGIIVLEQFLVPAALQVPFLRQILLLLYASQLGLFFPFIAAVGVGALAVLVLEQLKPDLALNRPILWAFVLCLLVLLGLRLLLNLPVNLLGIDRSWLIGIVLGVFWKGRPYWRW